MLTVRGQACVKAVLAIREKFAERICRVAEESGRTGEPMLRPLEYVFPDRGYAGVKDQFMMGDSLMVAPQLEKGAMTRKVIVPPGRWIADDGSEIDGPTEVMVATPLERLPYFDLVERRHKEL